MTDASSKRNPRPALRRWLAVVVLAPLLAAAPAPCPAQAGPLETANVMAPLDMRGNNQARDDFRRQLQTAKAIGVKAVAVDVWWGVVAANGDGQWDWSYYDSLFDDIAGVGLHLVPVMSFHKCGGNVGDACDIPIPSWLWTAYTLEQPGRSQFDLMYRSEQDNANGETLALWRDDWALPKYKRFMREFQAHFAGRAALIDEISIGTGPAGELRYPSYNAHDSGSGWPNRGFFQAYSAPARADFRTWAMAKDGDLAGVNRAWGATLGSVDQIGPPDDGTPADGRASTFVQRDDFRAIVYGQDFVDWYSGGLIEHGHRMLEAAHESFDGAFATIPLGLKIPGVHWQMAASASHPRIAEIAAGLIRTSVDYASAASGHGYGATVAMIHGFHNARRVNLHFTALEMDNCEDTGSCQVDASQAKALVFWVAQAAADGQVAIKGENALAGGVTGDHGWDNIENAFRWASYNGLTVLRIGEVTDNPTGRTRYQRFIAR
jgi:beta-amylase